MIIWLWVASALATHDVVYKLPTPATAYVRDVCCSWRLEFVHHVESLTAQDNGAERRSDVHRWGERDTGEILTTQWVPKLECCGQWLWSSGYARATQGIAVPCEPISQSLTCLRRGSQLQKEASLFARSPLHRFPHMSCGYDKPGNLAPCFPNSACNTR